MIAKGKIIVGPEGERYRVSRDIKVGDVISVDVLVPINGEAPFKPRDLMPSWVGPALMAVSE